MRFSLRTLLLVMLLMGPLCAWGWSKYHTWRKWQRQQERASVLNYRAAGVVVAPQSSCRVIVYSDVGEFRKQITEIEAKLRAPEAAARAEEFRQVVETFQIGPLPNFEEQKGKLDLAPGNAASDDTLVATEP